MYLELIILLVLGTFILIFISTALLERQQLHDFVLAPTTEPTRDSSYFEAMNVAAGRLGFASAGVFVQNRASRMYQAQVAIWISPDRATLLRIGGGTTARVPIKRTILTSLVEPDRIIQTQDDFGIADLSGLTSRKIVLNADLDEMLACHCERLASCPGTKRSFSPGAALADWQSIQEMRAQQMVRLGLAKFLNQEQSVWRHTLKGAWLKYFEGFRSQLAEGKAQKERISKKRPGAT
jgi:hypothetical protein